MKYATLAIHGGEKDDSGKFGVNYPIYPDSTFIQPEIGKFRDFCYSRGSNPTRNAVERLAADLEGAGFVGPHFYGFFKVSRGIFVVPSSAKARHRASFLPLTKKISPRNLPRALYRRI